MKNKFYLMIVFTFYTLAASAMSRICIVPDSVYFPPASLQKNPELMLEKMDKEQLSLLIDSLLQLEILPGDLIASVNQRVSEINKVENSVSEITPSLPSSNYYFCWEINKLFPEKDMLKMKGDTSLSLVLDSKEQSGYSHPVNGMVTSDFGWRDSAQHNGTDIRLKKGDKVVAVFDGMVRVAGNHGSFGNVVIIRHYNGLETVYAHLSKIKVKPGQVVISGQMIGLGGSTGVSTGPHLHFEVRFKGVPVNPKYLISFTEQKLISNEMVLKQTRWGVAAYPKNEKTYVVERGDTLFEISKHFGTTYQSIKELNGFVSGRYRLNAGQRITVMK